MNALAMQVCGPFCAQRRLTTNFQAAIGCRAVCHVPGNVRNEPHYLKAMSYLCSTACFAAFSSGMSGLGAACETTHCMPAQLTYQEAVLPNTRPSKANMLFCQ